MCCGRVGEMSLEVARGQLVTDVFQRRRLAISNFWETESAYTAFLIDASEWLFVEG